MSSKIINIVIVCILSLFVAERANAGLIIGDIYSDNTGVEWQYVGSFDLADGPDRFDIDNITPYNGIEAAQLIFGALSATDLYALSSNDEAGFADIANFIVNHKAWYDTYDSKGLHEASESLRANNAGDLTYDAIGDISAYIFDRAFVGENINHVFKTVEVPEPTTFAIFSLAIMGLMVRRLKK